MKSLFAVLVCVLAPFGSGCLNKQLNPGRCNSTADCHSGQTCDLAPQANGTCVCASPGCMDGGAGAGGSPAGTGGAGGAGGVAGTGGIQDGSAGAGGCQPACAAPKGICANSTCVECVTSADCATATKPICDMTTNTCGPCTSDDQCVMKQLGANPGVCMAHQDGRCATIPETIFVQNDSSTCSDTATTDPAFASATKPLCTMQPVATLLSASKDVVLVRGTVQGATWTYNGQGSSQLTIVGQQSAVINAGGASPAFSMSVGSAYMRAVKATATSHGVSMTGGTLVLENVTLAGSSLSDVGVNATGGSLTLKNVTVNGWGGGGILLDGAAFDIENTTITNNGPSADDTLGGIRIQNPPPGGPTQLNLLTVQANNPSGISCSTQVPGTGVLASGNVSAQITSTCGFLSCGTASTTCGAQ